MISILIPVFNRDVHELVDVLSKQVAELKKDAEIIVMDDGSEGFYQRVHDKLSSVPFVRYYSSAKNNGRIRTRQLLAGLASFEWLLFLDCDSKILTAQFLQNFLLHVSDPAKVTVGGRVYALEMPADCGFRLHWKYGAFREKTIPGLSGYHNRFMSNNFLISKSVFNSLDFSANWEGYGYEDTWMAIQFASMQMTVQYIDNPVQHEGLEILSTYLSKCHEALNNLKRLSGLIPSEILEKHVRLFFYYRRLRSLRMLWVMRSVYRILGPVIHKSLHSCDPSLWLFDLYRLQYFASMEDGGAC